MSEPAPTPYDKVLYPSYTRIQTHPDRLATIGMLLGMEPTPVEHCRMLELGCGNGSNIGPIAFGLPDSQFVGVDLAALPIANARRMVDELNLKNLTFHNSSITDVRPEFGKFDYIVCHGVYSWVPEEVRDAILRVCRENLAPNGIAFVSYNTYPGNRLREMIREMMLFHTHGFEEPREKIDQARALAGFVAAAQDEQDLYRKFLKAEMEMFLRQDGNYFFHDALAEINTPFYFYQFMNASHARGLAYLGEADFHMMLDLTLPPAVGKKLDELSGNRIAREQYLDFLRCRRFRQTLLCHPEAQLDLSLKSERITLFHLAGSVSCTSEKPSPHTRTLEKFENRQGARVQTDSQLAKIALLLLEEEWPQSIAFSSLLARAQEKLDQSGAARPDDPQAELREFENVLFRSYATGLIELHTYSPKIHREVSDKPAASSLARWQVCDSNFITTLFHASLTIEDALTRELLALMDGTRNRADLLAALEASLEKKRQSEGAAGKSIVEDEQTRTLLAQALDQNIARMARMGLLAS
jgi:methyltransferase-like protein/SAM-dependent methyltransferase